jgi:hypothetical protein
MTDYETDPRPFADCLKDFAAAVNGGKSYGARPKAASELRVSGTSLRNWMEGRPCSQEMSFRRLMTFIAGGDE